MWSLVVILYSVLAGYELVPLYKQQLFKDFWVNAALMLFSFTIAFLMSLNISIPSPAVPIRNFIVSIFMK